LEPGTAVVVVVGAVVVVVVEVVVVDVVVVDVAAAEADEMLGARKPATMARAAIIASPGPAWRKGRPCRLSVIFSFFLSYRVLLRDLLRQENVRANFRGTD
jgi:hypothetical protein